MNELSKPEEMMATLAADIAFQLFVESKGTIDPTDFVPVVVGAYFMGMRNALSGDGGRFVEQLKNMLDLVSAPSEEEIMNLFFPKEK